MFKFLQVNESPYHTTGEYEHRQLKNVDPVYSEATLIRVFDKIGQVNLAEFYLSKTKAFAVAVDPTSRVMYTHLSFKKIPTEKVNLSNVLQVDGVMTGDSIQGLGMTAGLYVSLVKAGFVLVSDAVQFTPGKQLWKRVARDAASEGLKVTLYRDGKFITNHYDGVNVPDSEIWSSGDDYTHYHTLLVLSK